MKCIEARFDAFVSQVPVLPDIDHHLCDGQKRQLQQQWPSCRCCGVPNFSNFGARVVRAVLHSIRSGYG
jgi:hypothetical protein